VPRRQHPKAKEEALRQHGALHPRPEAVTDENFQQSEFFDPRDLVQVKYEMLRRVEVDKRPVTHAAASFGLSRPTFYLARAAFEEEGVVGLLPGKRGPRRAHKLTVELMAFLRSELAEGGPLPARELAARVQKRFGVLLHPRTIEKALRDPRRGKKGA
jgi:transposase